MGFDVVEQSTESLLRLVFKVSYGQGRNAIGEVSRKRPLPSG
jgi:hypothetical protein